jgi:exopolysaccharide production protein ExoQ
MNPSVASLVYALGVAGLFFLNRDYSVRTSKALWLPVVYLWILGSRPVSFWLGATTPDVNNMQLDGSPLDGAFFGILLIAALCVLVYRRRRVLSFLNSSGPILAYFIFCLLSVIWSDFPDVAFKRWIKAIGDLLMILIVLTDKRPVAALSRLFSRTAFILVPFSLLFIKYYPYLGRTYDPWTGRQAFTGLATDKNMLGVITYVVLLGAVWRVLTLYRSDEIQPHRGRILFAQGTLLVLGVYLLITSNSVTSIVGLALGTGLLLATSTRFVRRHAAAVHALVLLLVLAACSTVLLGGGARTARQLGRDATFSGRTDIWAALIPMAPNPLVGAGFESFWISRSVRQKLAKSVGGQDLNEAHNGYIEVYLELGWVGVGLLVFLLIDGYRRSVAAFRRDPAWGGLLIAFVVSAMAYNLTEAGFRMLDPIWIFLLLAIVASGSIVSGIVVESSKSHKVAAQPVRRSVINKWVVAREDGRSI